MTRENRTYTYPIIGSIDQFPLGDSAGGRVGVVEVSQHILDNWGSEDVVGESWFREEILWTTFNVDTRMVNVVVTAEPAFHAKIDIAMALSVTQLIAQYGNSGESHGTITSAAKAKFQAAMA